MTDLYDMASDRELADRELSIKQARAQNQPLKTTGFCLMCNERLEHGRWCDTWCRDEHQRHERIAQIKGIGRR